MPTRPTRTPIPLPPLVARISPAPAIFESTPSDFAGFTQHHLGDLGTNTDGWDAAFNALAAPLDDDIAQLSTFDELLSNLAFSDGDFAKTYLNPVDSLLPGLLDDGEQLNNTVQNPGAIDGAVTVTPPVDPPSNPPPEEPPPDPGPWIPPPTHGYGGYLGGGDWWWWW